jgi:hypothetical protein
LIKSWGHGSHAPTTEDPVTTTQKIGAMNAPPADWESKYVVATKSLGQATQNAQ